MAWAHAQNLRGILLHAEGQLQKALVNNHPPEIGELLGAGNFACVYDAPDDPDNVIKATTCVASIALWRELIANPQPGFPRVFAELLEEREGTTWFLMERLEPVWASDREANAVLQAMSDTLAYVAANNRESYDEASIVGRFAQELAASGLHRVAEALRYLAELLADGLVACLDMSRSNLMRDANHRLVLSDPVCEF